MHQERSATRLLCAAGLEGAPGVIEHPPPHPRSRRVDIKVATDLLNRRRIEPVISLLNKALDDAGQDENRVLDDHGTPSDSARTGVFGAQLFFNVPRHEGFHPYDRHSWEGRPCAQPKPDLHPQDRGRELRAFVQFLCEPVLLFWSDGIGWGFRLKPQQRFRRAWIARRTIGLFQCPFDCRVVQWRIRLASTTSLLHELSARMRQQMFEQHAKNLLSKDLARVRSNHFQ